MALSGVESALLESLTVGMVVGRLFAEQRQLNLEEIQVTLGDYLARAIISTN